ncbi:MAG: RagB/SusD family nutrient uptake outer membrane protein [Lunatimonas sp.]|uniref:RagB/SusD family nutrient uptake outer membrane protein n=1 Tax=Lunatimonas sp. TaxID=2060141 RepID=UPI00263A7657|nr:RagB/SusD family nutrient uptake outer membrane protein [Lunatimonas sp.]MCC5937102.1 RagB/SusD family nutrient uptake outer membrane protein [Lunatimonas sp.]
MKNTLKKYIYLVFAASLTATGCGDLLEEQPRQLTPDFFRTAQGLESGITAAYASFRNFYGNEGGMNVTVYGTDEFTHGEQVTNPPFNVYNNALNPMEGSPGSIWGRSYPAINTCNGIIELGQDATDLPEADRNRLIAEAKFIRANWYYLLVTQFGEVTLDLGSGPLRFNQSTENLASRAPIADVYQAIIDDLETITDGLNGDDLPDARPGSGQEGRAWKASALHLLSKVYLTRAWSAAGQSGDYQRAYDIAMQLINNKATYGVDLLPDYANVHSEGNEYNSETLFMVNWNDNIIYNDYSPFGGPNYQNRSSFFFNCRYDDNLVGLVRDVANGRPWVRYKPTEWLLNEAFADKINDSRFDKSFKTVWYVNSVSTRNPKGLALGDTAVWMVPQHLADEVAPTKDTRRYLVFLPEEATDPNSYFGQNFADYTGYNVQNRYYPVLKKYLSSAPRPNNDANITSLRPFIVYRFAETYLIAAEAAYQLGNATEAANLLNVVRARAAASPEQVSTMTGSTLGDLNSQGIDYILDERTRELAGEQMRWMDLVRTGRLVGRVTEFNSRPARPGALVPEPQPHHVLRPIPKGQIDSSVDPSQADGRFVQNPGY